MYLTLELNPDKCPYQNLNAKRVLVIRQFYKSCLLPVSILIMYPIIGQYIHPDAEPVCESHTAPANVHILCVLGTEASGMGQHRA